MLEYMLLIVGLGLLIKGADYLVDGSSSLAKKLGISSLVIGLTIVSFGTSMPELLVNIIAATTGASDISLGNIIGSNIANILLILGATALITTIHVQKSTTYKEIPFSLLAVLLLLLFIFTSKIDNIANHTIYRSQGIVLLGFFIIFLYYVYELSKKEDQSNVQIKELPTNKSIIYTILGIIGLYIGGKWTVESAVTIAQQLGISDFLISATIIALGTSLPELITSIMAAKKNNIDLAVGNVVGSNIFNILWILGLTATISPLTFSPAIITDTIILVGATLALFISVLVWKRHAITRGEGIIFLICYVGYIAFLIIRG